MPYMNIGQSLVIAAVAAHSAADEKDVPRLTPGAVCSQDAVASTSSCLEILRLSEPGCRSIASNRSIEDPVLQVFFNWIEQSPK